MSVTMNPCTADTNVGKNCDEIKIYGTFGTYGIKLACKHCLRFLGWGKPGAQAQAVPASNPGFISPNRADLDDAIAQLLQHPKTSDWERQFLGSLESQDFISVKQREIFGRMLKKTGIQIAEPEVTPVSGFPSAQPLADPANAWADIPF